MKERETVNSPIIFRQLTLQPICVTAKHSVARVYSSYLAAEGDKLPSEPSSPVAPGHTIGCK